MVLLSFVTIFSTAEADSSNWIYISTVPEFYNLDLYYDSNSVTVDSDHKTFKVTKKLIYNDEAKREAIQFAKDGGYYTTDMEKISCEIEDLIFDYSADKYFVTDWYFCADDGTRVYWTSGTKDWFPVSEIQSYGMVYNRVKRDFNII